ncbi:MAG: protein kinase, partial [Planctomycetota bacterium]
MSVDTTGHESVLDEATRDFVRRSLHAGLVELDGIKKVVVSLMTESREFTPERLAEGLVGADLLTPWQAKKLLAGKARGFHLGNYLLLRPLGRGGMGVVFLAQHSVMNRLMALKILPPEASKDPRRIERFKEEARASAKLDHPHIVQAYDFSESDGKLFIVMEYIEGIDLHRAIVR